MAVPSAIPERRWMVEAAHAKGLNLRMLARRSGVSMRTITYLIAGHGAARMATRRALLDALGLPMERHRELFGPLPTWTRRS